MNSPTKVVGYLGALAVVFVAAFGVGKTVAPESGPNDPPAQVEIGHDGMNGESDG